MHRFELDKSSKKHNCPSCGKRRFVRYIDKESNSCVSDEVGRCDREDSCSYHLTPKQHFENNEYNVDAKRNWLDVALDEKKETHFIDKKYLRASMNPTLFEKNHFITFLRKTFGDDIACRLVALHNIGISKRWSGSTVFWQIDKNSNIHQAKVMLYNPETGKRNKETGAYFAGKAILRNTGIKEPNLEQCFYGQHLITKGKTIGVVESEKTAILMTGFSMQGKAPDYSWIATGGKNGCKWTIYPVYKALIGHRVILYPDLNAYEDWLKKASFLKDIEYCVSSSLERIATEQQRQEGLDIADAYLMQYKQPTKAKVVNLPLVQDSKTKILEGMVQENPAVGELVNRLSLAIER